MKTSIAWWGFENCGLSPDDLIRAAVELGYAGFEFAPPEQWGAIRDAGLEIVADRGHQGIGRGLNDLSQHARCESELLASIDRAGEWQIPVLVCFSGERRGISEEAGAVNTATALRRVAKAAEDAGVLLALELLNSKIDHPGYQCDSTPWGVQVIEWVDSPAVKLLYDVYHMQIMEGDVIRTIRQSHQHFGHYHVAGNPGRNEPDDSQELNYPPVYRAIAATGYRGYVGMEFIPAGDPVEALRAAHEQLSRA
ncbi:MAG: TIM barrel protein [Thermomicrobiales bacterium]|nr:TIM barrel protein [Thermomicrobiales bacterium]